MLRTREQHRALRSRRSKGTRSPPSLASTSAPLVLRIISWPGKRGWGWGGVGWRERFIFSHWSLQNGLENLISVWLKGVITSCRCDKVNFAGRKNTEGARCCAWSPKSRTMNISADWSALQEAARQYVFKKYINRYVTYCLLHSNGYKDSPAEKIIPDLQVWERTHTDLTQT